MKQFKLLLTTIILFSKFMYGQNAPKWKDFTNTTFSIQVPSNWQIDTNHVMGTLAIFYSPLEAANDRFKENVNVLVQKHQETRFTLEQYRTISEQQLGKMGVGVGINESELKEDQKGAYYHLVYTMTSGGVFLKIRSKAYLIKGAVFLITYTATFVDYEKYEKLAEQMFNSLQITAPKA